MKHFFTIVLASIMALPALATDYCHSEITGINHSHKAWISMSQLSDGNYQFVFLSEDTFTGYNTGSNFFAEVNGVGGTHVSAALVQNGKQLSWTTASTPAPHIYVGDFFVNYSDGEEHFTIPTDANWNIQCGDGPVIGPDTITPGGNDTISPGGNDTTSTDTITPPNPKDPVTTVGTCLGHSNAVDAFYTEHDAAAATSLEQGYDWQFSTGERGLVTVRFAFMDNFVGFAAPQMMFFDANDQLTTIVDMSLQGQVATAQLNGQEDGNVLRLLVKAAYAEHVLFTERISYTVGTSCEPTETGIENIHSNSNAACKVLHEGNLYIKTANGLYTIDGRRIE